MHPAYSVIFFTVASGAGYGMLFLAGVLALLERLPLSPWFAWPFFIIAFALVSAGLLSSLLHLGHPERFLKALTQWRSSWLSREGVLAIATFAPTGLFALGWLFVVNDTSDIGPVMQVLALIGSLLCVATVHSTSMIYASLKPIPQWHRGDVTVAYLVLGLASGALLVGLLGALTQTTTHLAPTIAIVALIVGFAVKLNYWRSIRRLPRASAATAIGMKPGTKVRPLDPPHTEPNYLQKEMGYRVARKHADKLRRIAGTLAFGLPLAALLVWFATDGVLAMALAVIAALSGIAGMAVERWLFFAEATHLVTLYYEGDAATD